MFSESTVVDWVFKGLFAVLGWAGITLHNRVAALEKETATKSELQTALADLKDTLKETRTDMKEHRAETQSNFKEIRSILLGKTDA